MINYTGEECLACKQKFTDSDDVVVCPECGTPYHRSCYKENDGCINHALHETGGSWMAEALLKKNAEDNIRKICPECSFLNHKEALRCASCGTSLENRECRNLDIKDKNVIRLELDADADYFGMNPMEIMDHESGITIGEMADYTRSNKLYFMMMFKKLKDSAVKFSVNILAFLFPEIYCAHRKMYAEAFILMLLRFIVQIPLFFDTFIQIPYIAAEYPDGFIETAYLMMSRNYTGAMGFMQEHAFSQNTVKLCQGMDEVIKVLCGLLANELYYRHIIRKLKKVRKEDHDYLHYRTAIKSMGGTSIGSVIGIILAEGILQTIFMTILNLI